MPESVTAVCAIADGTYKAVAAAIADKDRTSRLDDMTVASWRSLIVEIVFFDRFQIH
jgi:hypothetical protein